MAEKKPTSRFSRTLVNTISGLFTKNTAVLSVCIFIALILWLLNALSKDYAGQITVSLRYQNLPEDKVLVEDIRKEVQLKVRAVGFNLLWSKLHLLSAEVDINFLNFPEQDYLVIEDALSNLSERLPGSYTLLESNPDTIHFTFDERLVRKVPVRLHKDIEFAKQFYYSDSIQLQPDSVTVSGPKTIVDTIEAWPTVKLRERNVDKTLSREIALAEPSTRSLELSHANVTYTIPVEQYTEQQLEVKIRQLDIPNRLEVVILPNKTMVTFLVGLSNYERVSKDQFDVVADFSTINISKNKQIALSLRNRPSFVRNIELSPEKVNYIIYK